MSGFAVVYERTNTPNDPSLLNKVMERLSHRGPDGSDVLTTPSISMGHWHFWTTPEEVGERQPLELNDKPFKIVLDGRIDNRSEIILQLGLDAQKANGLSDAALILNAYHHWSKDCFKCFVGEFALVIFDEEKNELICVRDHLGDRTLFYESNDARLVIASEAWAVLGAHSAGPELNESTVAHFFAIRVPEDGQTFFKNIHELLPAHIMSVNSSGQTVQRYWQPDPHKKTRYKTDEEYARHFLALLEESVRCRMRSTTPVGILMSGGLDSTSIACLAARMLAPNLLTAISNVYDELSDCDEREYINAVKAQWNIRSIQIPCDDAWTYKDWENWPRNPNQPEIMPFRLVVERDYQRAQDEGLRVLFTGEAGDPLYIAGREWLADFITEGRFQDALHGFRVQIKNKGLRYPFVAGHLRPIVRILLERFAPWFLNLRRRQITHPAWLCRAATKFLKKDKPWVDPALERHGTLLGLRLAYHCSRENISANHHNLELRHPYRDRRLIEFVISLPAYMLHYGGLYKHILRIAMRSILPESVRLRKKAVFLNSLFLRGFERETQAIQDNLYGDHKHAWREFVEQKWLFKNLSALTMPNLSVVWLCISYESWRRYSFPAK